MNARGRAVFVLSLGPLLAGASPVRAQSPATAPLLRLDVSLIRETPRGAPERRTYGLLLRAADDKRARLLTGDVVTLRTQDREAPTVTLKQVGVEITCSTRETERGRYRLELRVQDSRKESSPAPAARNPALRTLRTGTVIVLAPGEKAAPVSVVDPLTGDRTTVEAALSVVD